MIYQVMSYDSCVMYVAVAQELVLEVFQALTSHTQIVKESIQKGEAFGGDTSMSETSPNPSPSLYPLPKPLALPLTH